MNAVHQPTLRLTGPFRLIAADGRDATPAGRRARALLAMLALAPDGARSRAWLQDRLWSDRDQSHGAASLRQELSALRKHCAGHGLDILTVERDALRLDRRAVRVVADDGEELLEGIDLRDPEFEDWLRDQRAARAPEPRAAARASVADRFTATASLPRLGLVAVYGLADAEGEDDAADAVLDLVSGVLLSYEAVDLVDLRAARETAAATPRLGPDWVLKVAASRRGAATRVAATLTEVGGRVLFAHAGTFAAAAIHAGDDVEFGAFVNRIVHVVLETAHAPLLARCEPHRHAARAALGAVHQIFRLADRDLDAAETLLAEAWDAHPRSSYLAWAILVNVLRVGERRRTCDQEMRERLQAAIARALEADAFNPLTLSLAAHAHGFVFRDYASALDLSEKAVEINRLHAIAWDIRGLSLGYAGEPERGYEAALRARALGGPPVYQPTIELTCCILATLCGRFGDGARHGAVALARMPSFTSTLRYAAACHGHLGQIDEAARLVRRLREFEPDFSVAQLRERAYPVAGVLGPALIEKGLTKVQIAA